MERSLDGDVPLEQTPGLKEHLHRENFFIDNFDIATPQHIIDQVKPSPEGEKLPPFENFGSQTQKTEELVRLNEIDIQLPVSPAPVSPSASDTLGSGAPGQETKIITGGGSLNSTLSANNEGGNQDLIRVI